MDYIYRRSIVTFVDVLGFREFVQSSPSSEIGELISVLKDVSAGDTEHGPIRAGSSGSLAFSDNVVRVCPVDTESRIGGLYYELKALVYVQSAAIDQGVFLRGGVTIGDVFFDLDREIVFGPALNRAFEIESTLANYPRIVVDPEVLIAHANEPALRGGAHDLSLDSKYIGELITKGDDQLQFVDYLRSSKQDIEEMEFSYSEFLENHRNKILANVRKGGVIDRVRQKYLWLSAYHNKTVQKQIPKTDWSSLLIEDKDLGF